MTGGKLDKVSCKVGFANDEVHVFIPKPMGDTWITSCSKDVLIERDATKGEIENLDTFCEECKAVLSTVLKDIKQHFLYDKISIDGEIVYSFTFPVTKEMKERQEFLDGSFSMYQ